ncbi:uncharacterized protein PRCAT00002779001 [Priceomyces carsonii]|uniref:uncharacterized protein n=1 Tax=Priceomyces carsonii TaxID=28549 RepID=UPI002ED9F6C7|nr:unnamed protein product [Priceomyces carsonii]
MSLRLVTLNSGNTIPSIGLGCYNIPNNQTSEIVHEAAKQGYRHFDTAVLYGNEHEVGKGISKFLKETPSVKRSDIFYTTKLWNSQCGYGNAKSAIRDCLEKVKDLGYIDLLLIHSPLCGPQKRLETYKALQESVDEGLVKNIGVSNYGIKHIEQLLEWSELKYPPAVNQIEISPWCMRSELAQWCLSHDIHVEAFSPLTHGSKLAHPPPEIAEICKKYNKNTAQILIKWSLQKGYIPLPKTKTPSRLKGNIDINDFKLTDAEIKAIDKPDAYEPTDWECTDAP